jgi:hypothetical protein
MLGCRLIGIQSGRCRASVRRGRLGRVCYGYVSLSVGVCARVSPCGGMGVLVGGTGLGLGCGLVWAWAWVLFWFYSIRIVILAFFLIVIFS